MQEETPLNFSPSGYHQGVEEMPMSEGAPEHMPSTQNGVDVAAHWKTLVGRVHEFREGCTLPEDELQSLSPSDGQRLLELITQSRQRWMLPDAVRGSLLLAAALERAQTVGTLLGVTARTGDPAEERRLLGRLQKRMLDVLDSAINPYEIFGIAPDQLDEELLQQRYAELYRIRVETQNKPKFSDEDWVNFYLVDRAKAKLLAELKARQQAEAAGEA